MGELTSKRQVKELEDNRSQTLLEHLKRFETHCIAYDNLQGAETLSGAMKMITSLRDEIKMLKWEYKVDMSKEEVQSIVDGRDYDRKRIKELEEGIRIAIKMLDIHNQFGTWTEGLAKLRGHLKALEGK